MTSELKNWGTNSHQKVTNRIKGNRKIFAVLVFHVVNQVNSPVRIDFYRPQRSCEGYVFTRVCLSTGEGVPGQAPLDQVHPPGKHTHPPRSTPRGKHTPPRETADAADGTHPTGMHSCFSI